MMQQKLTPVDPMLQAAMALAQGTQQGAVAPITPEGQPTVVGRMLQQAMPQPGMPPGGMPPQGMPPGLPQMRQNAGIAGQIQAMQMQEAQKQLMQQAQAQQRMQQNAPVLGGGIAAAPGAQGVRMAEGGIVGYAGDEGSWVDSLPEEALLRRFVENYRQGRGLLDFGGPTTEKPAPKVVAPEVPVEFNLRMDDPANAISALVGALRSNPNMPAGERKAIGDEIAALSSRLPSDYAPSAAPPAATSATPSPAPAAASPTYAPPAAPRVDTTAADVMFEKGLATLGGVKTEPPAVADITKRFTEMSEAERAALRSQGLDPDYIAKEIERRGKLSEEEVALQRRRAEEAKAKAQREGIKAFLGGGRGRTLGEVMRGAATAGQQSDEAFTKQIRTAEDAQLAAQKANVQEQFLLQQARHQIAMGNWKGAQESLAKAQEERNKQAITLGKAQIDVGEAKNRQALGAAGIAGQTAAAFAPGKEEQMFRALGNGDLLKGAQIYSELMKKGGPDIMAQYLDFLKASPMLAMDPQKALQQFVATRGLLGGAGQMPQQVQDALAKYGPKQ